MHVPRLEADCGHVWKLRLDRPKPAIDAALQLLAADERARAARFVFDVHRDRFIACRSSLRLLLGQYLDAAPAHLTFRYNDFGKPELAALPASLPLRFNVSHCDDWALIAVTLEHPLGVDIERLRQLDDLENVARNCFSAQELQALLSVPASHKAEAFFNCWTRKEALIKAWGDGFSHPLKDFDVTLLPGEPPKLLRVHGDSQAPMQWSLHAWRPLPDHIAALAVNAPAVDIIQFDASSQCGSHAAPPEATLRCSAD
jgi:4'-phosphopantetheinyl transferase